ncbi:methyl-accepting chemotaxis protein [Undibacterium luofuense]|uniref:MCP four helix bundle domain-containing protein n=1 Tax=Undibacterium luofuense TaxID=2828733 RepID=A0A941I647_9BURK|nr:methyl-accepting chemotaxis protein [Undibacterium luofuense]MBR7782306.1 MCP four helix bundle domain-containing protein [Undibacterium luofuense]
MKFFIDMKISAKLITGFTVVLLLTLFVGIFSITQLSKVNEASVELGTNWMPSVKAAMGIKERVSRLRAQEAQMAFADTPEDIEKYAKRSKEAIDGLIENQAAYEKLISSNEERRTFDVYRKEALAYFALSEKMTAMAKAGQKDEAVQLLRGESSKLNSSLRDVVDKLVDTNADGGKAAYEQAAKRYETAKWLVSIALIAAVAIGFGLAFFIARMVSRPLEYAVKVAETVATGDLTSRIEVHSHDETGMLLEALRKMNESLVRIVSEVRTGTSEIRHASKEIADGNMELSSRTETQAGSLEETASSMEEITSTIQHNADNARQANQLANSASEVAQRGGNVVSEVVSTMGSINESSKKIVDIISVIDGIAFQTNILALNAAVEAARAGEQGRGFAVVASEVRSLAQRSASAAKEIKELINNSVDKVEQGSRLVDQAGSTMSEVVDSVKRVSDIISEITAAGLEQSAGISQINDAVTEMDTLTQQNAALVEEAAAAAGSLQEQAEKLNDLVSVFRVSANEVPAQASFSADVAKPVTRQAVKAPVKKPVAAVRSLPKAQPASRPAPKAQAPKGSDEGDWEEF